jgi:hypothetical protein
MKNNNGRKEKLTRLQNWFSGSPEQFSIKIEPLAKTVFAVNGIEVEANEYWSKLWGSLPGDLCPQSTAKTLTPDQIREINQALEQEY